MISNEANIKDLQEKFVVLDKSVSLLTSITFQNEQDRMEWECLQSRTKVLTLTFKLK